MSHTCPEKSPCRPVASVPTPDGAVLVLCHACALEWFRLEREREDRKIAASQHGPKTLNTYLSEVDA